MKVGIIDLGTNTFHLLVADVAANGSWKKIHQRRITVKIGKGGIQKNIITATSYKRGINAVLIFNKILKEYKVKKVFAFGTAAFRSASNGKSFLNEVLEISGIKVKVISGNDEAVYIFRGVRQAVDLQKENSLIMDIGGGSVEFILTVNNKLVWKQSLKMGAAYLLGHFNPSDPLKKSELMEIRGYIRKNISTLIKQCKKYKPVQLIGSAGSFETFASMIRFRFPESGSHYGKTDHPIKIAHFNAIYKDLLKSDQHQRKSMKGLIKMRVDMIVPAAILLKTVLEETGLKKMQLSSYALKEGALISVIDSKSTQK